MAHGRRQAEEGRVGTISPAQTAAQADSPVVTRPVARPAWVRLRFASYIFLLALIPVALAYWAFASLAAGNEVERADAHLNASLHAAVTEYAGVLDDAETRGVALASSERVQQALVRRDTDALVRLARANPNVTFLAGSLVVGRAPRLSAERTVNVVVDDRPAGRIAVAVPLGDVVLARLGGNAGLAAGDVLAFTSGDEIAAATGSVGGQLDLSANRPDDVRIGRDHYRALAAPLPEAPAGTSLAVLRPQDAIEAEAGDLLERIGWAAFAMLAAVALGAYAGAPVLSRGVIALQQRAFATRVLSNVGDGVVVVDREGVVTFWNRAAEVITGLRAGSVRGHRIEQTVPQWREVAERVRVGTGGPDEVARAETIPLEIAGKERWLSFAGVAFDEGVVYTFRDVTEERRLEEARADFVATVSHELRTPLASIYGAAVTLRRSDVALDAEGRDQLLTTIAEQSDRLARIVEEILLTSRLAAGELPIVHGKFDPREVVRNVVDAASVRLPTGLRIEVSEPRSLPAVAGDAERARQVLANLVDNAIKYSPDGGRIRVRVEARNGHVRFAVQDEGIGVPEGERERIFEKFYRLDPNLTRGAGGTGLGLYIARELVRRMNGRMRVWSEAGRGSTFWFELPIAQRESGSSA